MSKIVVCPPETESGATVYVTGFFAAQDGQVAGFGDLVGQAGSRGAQVFGRPRVLPQDGLDRARSWSAFRRSVPARVARLREPGLRPGTHRPCTG